VISLIIFPSSDKFSRNSVEFDPFRLTTPFFGAFHLPTIAG